MVKKIIVCKEIVHQDLVISYHIYFLCRKNKNSGKDIFFFKYYRTYLETQMMITSGSLNTDVKQIWNSYETYKEAQLRIWLTVK